MIRPGVRAAVVFASLLLAASGGVTVLAVSLAERAAEEARAKRLRQVMEKLRPLHKKLGKPRPGDWLDRHHEPGQTFEQYLRSRPVVPDDKRNIIYVQPLGQFTPTQRKIVKLTADFLGRFFAMEVKFSKDLPLSVIPPEARRTHPQWGVKQILSTYVLEEVLKPRLPKDAFAYIAFTASDLWPGPGWNFVFGQASLRERVGVWSIHRNGDADKGEGAFRLCLLRTLKTAAHEVGHMLSMQHCTKYECGMCGSNHREESDRRPIALCPECAAKVWWATKADPIERYRKLAEFFRARKLRAEAEFCEKSIRALGGKVPTTRSTSRPAG
jgi:archaemetzincin